jgi:hypothetical protein
MGRKKKAATKRTRSVTVNEVALGIDSNYEPVTKAAFEYREKHVYPYLKKKGFSVEKCQGTFARRIYVAPKARKAMVVYLTGVGHGSYDTYTGHYYDPIFRVGDYSKQEADGKIAHFLSCQTGRTLGPDFVTNGCKAYFGYDENFVFIMNDSDIFFECDSEIDKAFADGATAKVVYSRTKKLYEKRIDELKSAGKFYVASTLATDLDRLRCPSSGGAEWGTESAKL